jgi:hypothetical protein
LERPKIEASDPISLKPGGAQSLYESLGPYEEVISQRRNLHVMETICDLLNELAPSANGPHRRLISFVADRPGHDGKPAYRNGRFVAWGASIGE